MTVAGDEQLAAELADDARLFPALRLLEQEQISVLSLDMFDTLVWRLVAEPTDAFVLLGHRLRDAGQLDDAVSPLLFARLRQRAEMAARRRRSPTLPAEVTLEEIYAGVPSHLFRGLGVPELVDMEVAFDRSIAFPDLEISRLARYAHDKLGARVVVVSDIYYSDAQLRSILDGQAFEGLTISKVFTSSQHKVGKGSGLFRVVLDDLGVAGDEVLHVGDNAEADVAAAEKEGVHAVHFDKFPHGLRTVLEREGTVGAADGSHREKRVDPVAGDLGLTALRSKAVSRAEGGQMDGAVGAYWRFGASVLGPVFTGYAEWVHARARSQGFTTVHCLMREGEFFGRLIDGARRYLGSDVVTRPLWLSRQVCARAAIFEASDEELSSFLQRRQSPTLRGFCESLGIGVAQLPELFNEAEGRLDDPELWQRTLAAISRRPEVKAAIVARSAALRQRVADYFLKTVGDARRIMLADLGWAGTIQAHLEKVLRRAGLEVETLGLYLLTTDLAADRMLTGVRTEGYLAAGGLPEAAVRWIVRSPEILEQVCMVDEGSLVDFTQDGEPVRAPLRQSPVQMLQRNAAQRGIVAFQREWGRYAEVVPVEHRALVDRAPATLLRVLLRFVTEPTEEEATMFRPWLHEEDYGSDVAEPVILDDLAPTLKYMTPSQFLALPMNRVYWPFGLAALYNRPLAMAARALADRELPPEAFAPVEEVEADLYLDVGGGYRRVGRASAGPNGNGLCFLREQLSGEGIRGLQFGLGTGPGVARVDSIRLAASVRGRSEPVVTTLQWPEDFRHLAYERCAALSENLLFGSRQAPHLLYRFPAEWGSDVYKVELELAFAWLPISPMRGAKAARRDVLVEAGRRAAGKVRSLWHVAEGLAGERAGPAVRG